MYRLNAGGRARDVLDILLIDALGYWITLPPLMLRAEYLKSARRTHFRLGLSCPRSGVSD